jgi:hypothetical protein
MRGRLVSALLLGGLLLACTGGSGRAGAADNTQLEGSKLPGDDRPPETREEAGASTEPPAPPPSKCVHDPANPTVVCGTDVCEGATPVCCEHVLTDRYACFATAGDTCTGLLACDDAQDCPDGEVCGANIGGKTFDVVTLCESPSNVGLRADGTYGDQQVCAQDCECSPGKTCAQPVPVGFKIMKLRLCTQ